MKATVKAYTLLETVLSMVIMSVIIIIAYSLVSSFLNQFRYYSETKERTVEYAMLKSTLKREFHASKEVIEEFNGITVILNDARKVRYEFNQNYVIRDDVGIAKDTFYIKTQDTNFDVIVRRNKRFVKKMSLMLNVFDEDFTLLLAKNYGAALLLNDNVKSWR